MVFTNTISDPFNATNPVSVQLAAQHLKPCKTEDSSGCYWDAKTMGNGRGHSFVAPPARTSSVPQWVHWHTIKTDECGKNHTAIVAWPARGGTSALICQSGVVETS
jgi:hypothetical protein